MPDGKGGKLCPICDSPLEPGSKKCGFCGTDLAIFDSEPDQPAVDEKVLAEEKEASESLDTKLEEVFFGPTEAAPEVAEKAEAPPVTPEAKPEAPAAEPQPAPVVEPKPEPAAAPEPEPQPEPEAVPEQVAEESAPVEEHFECPQCGRRSYTRPPGGRGRARPSHRPDRSLRRPLPGARFPQARTPSRSAGTA